MYSLSSKCVCVTEGLKSRAKVIVKPGYKFVLKSCRMNMFRNGLYEQNKRMETCGVMNVQEIGRVAGAENLTP
jgi:hypothetical protein